MRTLLGPLAGVAALLCGCASFPASYSPEAPVVESTAGRVRGNTTKLDVLTYNVEGLQWPARSGRAPDLARIGRILRDLRLQGRAPDVVLFQEVFSPAAVRAVKSSGYPYMIGGPSRTASSRHRAPDARREGRRRPTKGEIGFRLMGSGLVIASRWPVTFAARDAYSRKTCAGFDCLANKGVVLARIAMPGVPAPVEIAATHMNAQWASKVKLERHRAAHRYQSEELALFLERHHAPEAALIMGGDFNMRGSTERFDAFRSQIPFAQVHEHCAPTGRCDVRVSLDGDAPWMDTQDLQFFASGDRMHVTPERVEAMFDGSPGSPRLSDHDGLRVVYRLTWGP